MQKILILEDEPHITSFLRTLLLREGFLPIEATDAGQALALAARAGHYFSLIIADVTEPCSGIDVSLEIIRSMPSLKVLLTSGNPPDNWSDRETALLKEFPAGSARILPKPYLVSEILRLVYDLIGTPAHAAGSIPIAPRALSSAKHRGSAAFGT